ncbi:MAG: cytochrome b N-terminal domain-containing protein [Wenzhouxiangellaceae bacterium]
MIRLLKRMLARVEAGYSSAFGGGCANPLHYLGALTVGFLWITLVTGIYLFIFYRTSLDGAWASVQALTHEQRFIGGIMRSVHRYASDAAVICLAAHFLREGIRGRFRGPRWFSWATGTPLIWIVLAFGITGYWMVWDELGLYVARTSAMLLDALPIFSDPMARNFLTAEAIGSRLFTLIAFIHLVGLPIVIVLAIWVHLIRVRYPGIHPPRALWAGSLVMLLGLALVWPVTSHPPADPAQVPAGLALDWFYLALFPLHDRTSAGTTWLLAGGATLLLAMLPLVPGGRPRDEPARVHLADCSGCSYCAEDCPYGAIDMVPRDDGRNFELQARVDPALCVACGICAGSCPSSSPFRQRDPLTTGIELPDWTIDRLRRELAPAEVGAADVLLIGCFHGAEPDRVADPGVHRICLPCIGMLPASVMDYALRRLGYRALLVSGCDDCDCHHRLGVRWLRERIAWQRPPALRRGAARERIRVVNLKPGQHGRLETELARLRAELDQNDVGPGNGNAEGEET